MGRALRGVPEYQMPVPAGVTTINNEFYFDNFTPGNGFIASLGLGAGASGAPVEIGPDGTPLPAPAPQTNPQEDEKQNILKLFGGH
jgi:penicillin-binding protein 1A